MTTGNSYPTRARGMIVDSPGLCIVSRRSLEIMCIKRARISIIYILSKRFWSGNDVVYYYIDTRKHFLSHSHSHVKFDNTAFSNVSKKGRSFNQPVEVKIQQGPEM